MRLYDYAASGNCFKVRLLLGLADIPCERIPVDIFSGDTLTAEYGRVNPFRETPVLQLDDGSCLRQSGAILTYLADGTPWLPEHPADRARALAWILDEQERLAPGVAGVRFRLLTGRWSPDSPEIAPRHSVAKEALDVMQQRLDEHEWLVGDRPTIADIACCAYLSRAHEARLTIAQWPGVAQWLDRIRALPGFRDDLAPYPPNASDMAGRSIYG